MIGYTHTPQGLRIPNINVAPLDVEVAYPHTESDHYLFVDELISKIERNQEYGESLLELARHTGKILVKKLRSVDDFLRLQTDNGHLSNMGWGTLLHIYELIILQESKTVNDLKRIDKLITNMLSLSKRISFKEESEITDVEIFADRNKQLIALKDQYKCTDRVFLLSNHFMGLLLCKKELLLFFSNKYLSNRTSIVN